MLHLALIGALAMGLDVKYDDGAFCDTREEIEYLVAHFDAFDNDDDWIADANFHFEDPRACSDGFITYVEGETVSTASAGSYNYEIKPILIVGLADENGTMTPVEPLKQWAATRIKGTPL